MMESIGDTYDDAYDQAGEVNHAKPGGLLGERIQSEGAGAQFGTDDGELPEAAEAPDDEVAQAAAPIFESVERELNGGPPLP